MTAAYQLPNVLDLNTATLSDCWLGVDYPSGSNSFKCTIAALETRIRTGLAGATNLTISHLSGGVQINSDTGTDVTILPATTGAAGVMSPADKTKLNNITSTVPVNLDTIGTSNHPAATATNASLVINPTTQAMSVQLDNVAGNQLSLASNGLRVNSTALSATYTGTTFTITPSTGTGVTIANATSSLSGTLSAADKTKLDFIVCTASTSLDLLTAISHLAVTAADQSLNITGGQIMNVKRGTVPGATNQLTLVSDGLFVSPTDLSTSRTATSMAVNSSTGADITLAEATTSLAGVLAATDKTKLSLITITGAVNIDTLSSLSHTAATAANASVLVTGQAINVRLSATGGNQLSLNADGLYVPPASTGSADRLLGVHDMGSVSGAVTINLSAGASRNKRMVLTGSTTFTIATGAPMGDFTLLINPMNNSITWPSNVTFQGAVPSLTGTSEVGVKLFYAGT